MLNRDTVFYQPFMEMGNMTQEESEQLQVFWETKESIVQVLDPGSKVCLIVCSMEVQFSILICDPWSIRNTHD